MTTKDRLKAIKAEINKLKEEAKQKAKQVFTDESKRIFEEFPNLIAFQWTQYTPYFADGDVCLFSVNEYLSYLFTDDPRYENIDLTQKDWHYDVDWYEGGYSDIDVNSEYSFNRLKKANDPNLPAIQAVSEFFRILDDDDFRNIFGDHVEVIITKNGSIVNEHEHE